MIYRVVTFQVVRVAYEVGAESQVEAMSIVKAHGSTLEPTEVGALPTKEWTEDIFVEPILPNGVTDFENVTCFGPLVEPIKPKQKPNNYLGLKGWSIKASPGGEYLYITKLGKPGDIHVKAEEEGLLVDIWNTPHDDAPECMDSMMVAYSDLEEFSEGDILGDSGAEILPQWRVTLYTGASKSEVIHFECWATDSMHAQELALMSWPKGEIIQYEVIS